MKFLCDVHIAFKVSHRLNQLGFQATHVNNVLDGYTTKDSEIVAYANSQDLIVITKDQDFRNSFLLKRMPKKLIKVSLGNITTPKLIIILESVLEQLKELHSNSDTFMIEIFADHWIVTH